MVSSLATVLGDATTEFGELDQHRVVQQTLVSKVVVERRDRFIDGRHQGGGTATAGIPLAGVRVVATGGYPVDACSRAANDRSGDRPQRNGQCVRVVVGGG